MPGGGMCVWGGTCALGGGSCPDGGCRCSCLGRGMCACPGAESMRAWEGHVYPGGVRARGCPCPGGVCVPKGVCLHGGMCGKNAPLWTEFLTHACYQLMTDIHNVHLQASLDPNTPEMI